MSESSKMGLFGSKDKNKELKKESPTKDESPDRYAPYCIDSDSETYDTEALSIMDINDIIGVHSEPVSDSTLESEIAALSQIITESKAESNPNVMDTTSHIGNKDSNQAQNVMCNQIDSNEMDRLEPTLYSVVTEVNKDTEAIAMKHSFYLKKSLCNDIKNQPLPLESCKRVDGINNPLHKIDSTSNITTQGSNIGTNKILVNEDKTASDIEKEMLCSTNESMPVDISTFPKNSNLESMSAETDVVNFAKNASIQQVNEHSKILFNVGSINESLQLIGEAYISEDSEDTILADNDLKEGSSSNCLTDTVQHNNLQTQDKESLRNSVTLSQSKPKLFECRDTEPGVEETMTNVTHLQSTETLRTNDLEPNTSEVVSEKINDEKLEKTDTNCHDAISSNEQFIKNTVDNVINIEDCKQRYYEQCTDELQKEPARDQDLSDTNVPNSNVDIPLISSQQNVPTEKETAIINEKDTINKEASKLISMPIMSHTCEVEELSNVELTNKLANENKLLDSGSNDNITQCTVNTDAVVICHSEYTESKSNLEGQKADCTENKSNLKAQKANLSEGFSLHKGNMIYTTKEKGSDIEASNFLQEKGNTMESASPADFLRYSGEKEMLSSTIFTSMEAWDCKKKITKHAENKVDAYSGSATSLDITDDSNARSDTLEAAIISKDEPNIVYATQTCGTKSLRIENTSFCLKPIASDCIEDAVENILLIEKSEEEKVDTPEMPSTSDSECIEDIIPKPGDSKLTSSFIDIHESTSIADCDKIMSVLNSKDALTTNANSMNNQEIMHALPLQECDDRVKTLHKTEDESHTLHEEEVNKEFQDSVTVEKHNEEANSNDVLSTKFSEQRKLDYGNETIASIATDDIVTSATQNKLFLSMEKIESSDNDQNEVDIKIEQNIQISAEESKRIVCQEQIQKECLHKEMDLALVPVQLDPVLKSVDKELYPVDITECNTLGQEQKEGDSTLNIAAKNVECMNVQSEGSTNTQNFNEVPCSSNSHMSVSDEAAAIPENEHKEHHMENDIAQNNLESILESSHDTVEMFPEEQCQNTQDIMTSILDNVANVTDFKNILDTEESIENDIEHDLQNSTNLPLVETEMEDEELAEGSTELLNKNINDTISAHNMDSLEGLLGLDLMPESEDNQLKTAKVDDPDDIPDRESIDKDVDVNLLLEPSNHTSHISQDADYIADVISSCLTNADSGSPQNDIINADIAETSKNNSNEAVPTEVLKINENIIVQSIAEDANHSSTILQQSDSAADFVVNPVETTTDLEESKMQLSQDILLGHADQNENLNDTAGIETSQPSSEISELESAVKFLQESEEQAIDSPLVLSPKMIEGVVNDISKETDTRLFISEDLCENTTELVAQLQSITSDSISISEAEIISEAAKLEHEQKLAAQGKLSTSISNFEINDKDLRNKKVNKPDHLDDGPNPNTSEIRIDSEIQNSGINIEHSSDTFRKLTNRSFQFSESFPKVSILEERLKEPPKIEIPLSEMTKVCELIPKDSLLIQKDARINTYQKMLESPKLVDKNEPKIMDTPRKDSEKHDFENVGSPRIILKIAKSAITDCSEPRSPKSPKIRSATNSPNPEDSPGQKLGKIKLKLSKSGHPSIISNENIEDIGHRHIENTAGLSPIGMKIKLSKSGDASIVSSEKHDNIDDMKEVRHKYEEVKRTESPIGMKIKLSRSGDASIVQQDSKETIMKHSKDKLDILQASLMRTESPIGMKIKLLKTGDASIIQPEKHETEEHIEGTVKLKEKLETNYDVAKRTDSSIGMKIKLSRSGDASIISPDLSEEGKEGGIKLKEKLECSPEIPKRTESPIGMKIKLTKIKGGASIISVENSEEGKELEISDIPKRNESPLGMKIKLSKSGDASIIHSELQDDSKECKHKEKLDVASDELNQSDAFSGIKTKLIKSVESLANVTETVEQFENLHEIPQRTEHPIGMKIKLSKSGDASIVPCDKQEHEEEHKQKESHQDVSKRTDSPLGMKIKFSRTGDASIIPSEISEEVSSKSTHKHDSEYGKTSESTLGVKIKLLKTGDSSSTENERREKHQRRRDDSPLEMKIKLSKTGHPTIIACDSHTDTAHKSKETSDTPHNFTNRYKESILLKEPGLKILKTGHSTIVQSTRSELTIEPVQLQSKKLENAIEISPKRKEVTISPIESKKSKLEAQLSQILPEVTIQPVISRDQKQLLFDPKTSPISRQQMNVISQEISITQVRPSKAIDMSMTDKLKDILCKNAANSPVNSDCEIIEHRPELIIVNENSNSSQDVVIIEEVPPNRTPEVQTPKRRGRPRRNPLPPQLIHPQSQLLMPRDPLALDEIATVVQFEHRENERPKRTCRNQKSYAPPRRGRGRGRGKRKVDTFDLHTSKKPRIEQDLTEIEASTMAVITIDESPMQQEPIKKSSELYKALKQPPIDHKSLIPGARTEKPAIALIRKEGIRKPDTSKSVLPETPIVMQLQSIRTSNAQEETCKLVSKPLIGPLLDSKSNHKEIKSSEQINIEKEGRSTDKSGSDEKVTDKVHENVRPILTDGKDILIPPGHANWLAPTSKKQPDTNSRNETVCAVQVIDEETRMSAESGSRSQTPARNISVPAAETIINEESQGSVLSTATTESEKVKVKNRRMEINFDPDEGPFTVDKIAEYEWPLDRKGETFMIQEQISQYLGVKSFKRKYPDLKRRMVDMEERNYLRENALVSEAMCDMGLTAVCSSEVLDVMCGDFPDQYEEYRKHMREKQVKEHSKKQKELTAAANAERNRIDLAEMAVQSALSWNVSLNKDRRENRKYSLDLQTFTIHMPKEQQKVEFERKVSHYPVALIPGQYTDYYREYTPAELRYYPLNTVLYGPMRPNERKFDSQSEGSQSDSDSDTSSDDSSSSSSEGTQDTEGSQSTMDDVDMEIAAQKDEIKLKCKMCLKTLNKHNKSEVLIQCGTCAGNVHPSCIKLPLDMVPHIQSYSWQCTDCKTCAQCHDPADEDKMLFCDMCDRGYHIYCVGLRRVPQGRWHCQECAVCANCGSREPGGSNSDRNSVAQWQHEYKKGDKNTRVYVSTLCVPCSKMRGDQGYGIRQEKLPV